MKSKEPIPRGERGAAMLAALCLAMVFAIALSSYIALCYVSLSTSTRNVVNEHSLELAEAGIEQALYYNNNGLSGWNVSTAAGITTVASPQLTMTASGLQATSGGPTPLNYGNGATGTVNVTYTYTAGQPVAIQSITSTAQMTLPTGTVTAGTGPTISRTLTYSAPNSTTAAAPLFVNAVAATSGVLSFKSGGTLDSYNSNPSAGVYQAYSSGIAGCSAVVLSGDTTTGSATVRLMDADVNGYAVGYDYTSPSTSNWLSYGSTGKLVGPNPSPSTFIDSSRILTSPVPYQPIYPENLPNGLPNLPAVNTTGGNNVLNTTSIIGNPVSTTPLVYNASGINVGTGVTVSVVGPVVLIVNGPGWGNAVDISGTGQIALTTTNAALTIFGNGGNVIIGGNGITNTSTNPLPKRVAVLSTTSSGYSVTISQSASVNFYGVVYFPYQAITVSTNVPIFGSIVGSAVSFTGTAPAVHYDNALRSPDSDLRDAAFQYITAPITVNSLVASVP
jgi:hypothetical protein